MDTFGFWAVVLFASILVLVKSSDWLSDAAEKIGLFLKIPSFIIGVTIVSIGTSMPELISSLIATAEGSSEIVVGNVLGSNITNIFLVLGIAAILAKKLEISYDLLHVDLPLFIGSTFLLTLAVADGEFTLFEGILSLFGVLLYILYTISVRQSKTYESIKKELRREHSPVKINSWVFIQIVVGAILIYFSAKYTVQSVVEISGILDIGKEVVAMTAISLGTSLPEMAVAINAARKGKSEMVVGSILGSSIFNSLGVMGAASLVGTVVIPSSVTALALPIMIIAAVLYFFITQEKQITQWEGWLLLIFYAFYIETLLGELI